MALPSIPQQNGENAQKKRLPVPEADTRDDETPEKASPSTSEAPQRKKRDSPQPQQKKAPATKKKRAGNQPEQTENTADNGTVDDTSPDYDRKKYNAIGEGDKHLDDGWFVDAKTKKKYKAIPKLDIDKTSGHANNVITDDIDTLNLNDSAEKFLAHLRVPPDAEEAKRIRREREKRAERVRKEYADRWTQTDDDE